jgi:molybdopterin-guanine dinucleotide biosynthesis protein A
MGRPKPLVQFCGSPLICRGLKRLGMVAGELIITSNDVESLDFLCSKVTFDNSLKLYSDLYEQRSALNGLYTALYHAKRPYVGVVACDMLFPSAPLLVAEARALEVGGADVAIPTTTHGYEPFHAVYRRETCLPLVREALEAGETKATCWFDKARVHEFTHEMVLAADPRGGAFINVNTPEELAAMEKRVLSGEMHKANGDSSDTIHTACGRYAAAATCGYTPV